MAFVIGLNTNTYHGFTLEDALEGAARAGIKALELAAVRGYTEHVDPDCSAADAVAIRSELEDRGFQVAAVSNHSNLTSPEGRASLRAFIPTARALGARYVVTGTGDTHDDATSIDDEDAFHSELASLAESADEHGLHLAIETHGGNFGTGAKLGRLLAEVDAPALRICYDTGNTIYYEGVEPYEDLHLALPHVVGLHLKDKTGAATEWNFPAVGAGDTDFSRVVSVLRKIGGNDLVPLNVEIEFTPAGPANVEEVHEALVESVRYLRTLGLTTEVAA